MTEFTKLPDFMRYIRDTEPRTWETCPVCNGNDREMACAYPSEGKAGCSRDKRLGEEMK